MYRRNAGLAQNKRARCPGGILQLGYGEGAVFNCPPDVSSGSRIELPSMRGGAEPLKASAAASRLKWLIAPLTSDSHGTVTLPATGRVRLLKGASAP